MLPNPLLQYVFRVCDLPEFLGYAPLPEGPEEARQKQVAQQLERLPHLRETYKQQAKIYLDEDHHLARRAQALGFSEPPYQSRLTSQRLHVKVAVALFFVSCAGAGQLMSPGKNSNMPDDLRLWGEQRLAFLYLGVRIEELEKLQKEVKMQRRKGKLNADTAQRTHGHHALQTLHACGASLKYVACSQVAQTVHVLHAFGDLR